MSIRQDLKIFGPVLWALVQPVVLKRYFEKETPMSVDPQVEKPDPDDEWVTLEYCMGCEEDSDHMWLMWKTDECVTSECMRCGRVVEFPPNRSA